MRTKKRVKLLEEGQKTLLHLVDAANQRADEDRKHLLIYADHLDEVLDLVKGHGDTQRKALDELKQASEELNKFVRDWEPTMAELKDWKETLAATVSAEEVKDWSDPVQVLAARMNRIDQVVRRRESDVAEMKDMLDVLKVVVMMGRNHMGLVSVLESPEKKENAIKGFDDWYKKLSD